MHASKQNLGSFYARSLHQFQCSDCCLRWCQHFLRHCNAVVALGVHLETGDDRKSKVRDIGRFRHWLLVSRPCSPVDLPNSRLKVRSWCFGFESVKPVWLSMSSLSSVLHFNHGQKYSKSSEHSQLYKILATKLTLGSACFASIMRLIVIIKVVSSHDLTYGLANLSLWT